MDKLLNAAKMASIENVSVEKPNIPENVNDEIVLTKDSTRQEILDWMMLFVCQRIDVEFSAFKGGYVLTKLMPDEARATEDIDFSIYDYKQYAIIKDVLAEMAECLKNYGVITEYTIKEDIGERSSGGIHMKAVDGSSDIKIDIGWHDLSYGITSWSYQGFNCNRFEVERMLSDKISAIYSRKRFRRTKDLYDFYILTSNFDVNLATLRDYVVKRGLIDWNADPFREDVMREYAYAYNKLTVKSISGVEIIKPEFNVVIDRLRYFMSRYNDNVKWSHLEKKYVEV